MFGFVDRDADQRGACCFHGRVERPPRVGRRSEIGRAHAEGPGDRGEVAAAPEA
ncbi:MAG: hypothetical protein ACREU3_09405 [Steroidobacteraceae bacterium]